MARNQEVPGSVRIRTGDGNAWRYDQIEKAADFYDRNRSDSVAFACHDIVELVERIESVLERDDLTLAQRQEIAETLSGGKVTFEIATGVDVQTPSN